MVQLFQHFPELPAEIRLQIWQAALPLHDKPSLFPWRLGCWELRPIPPSDPAYDPATPEFPRLEFKHDRLHPLRCTASSLTPLLGVSREARHVAQKWVKENGFRSSSRGGYTRRFNPERDVIFLPWLMKDDESTSTLLDTRSVLYNELFDKLQSPEALDAMRREAERRQRLKAQHLPPTSAADDQHSDDDYDEADYRKVDPWSAARRFAMPARRSRSNNEWTLLPHFFPKFDTLYILAPRYDALGQLDLNGITGEKMEMRRLYDLDPDRETSYMEFDGQDNFAWKGTWERDESLLVPEAQEPEVLGAFRGDQYDKAEVVDGLLVMNIEDCVKDLGSAVRNTRDKRPFRFRPVPAWWTESPC
ncbi:hypothetical protein NLU13_0626 [Sarocladium strictum]|uniref:2EXR domain-containing protein n=1 Tax=Sarocladium strictum TaxID=5046 RepID=A0AA39GQ62_SARSR|nr:hypothetical protein NLU13_0626 [Sarocladium strictum]